MKNMFENGNTFYTPICNSCKHYIEGLTCDAFSIIPDEIIEGKNDHSKPLPGQDNNIVYEKIIEMKNKNLLAALMISTKFDPDQPRDNTGRWSDTGKGNKYDIPQSAGVKAKFHTPNSDEDPDQEYQVTAIYPAWTQKFKDGTKQTYPSRADIVPLNTGLTFPGIQTVDLTDLVEVTK